ncbi:MAG TPA: hypothetical protein VM582_01605 [Candidatus Thermoplasmatota archaeon]|nr:hypothetical protein [Candidatus Thermoplasmatota archaeon]
MRDAPWKRLRLSEDEWRACERSALEMSLAMGLRVSAQQVAREYAAERRAEMATLARERWGEPLA